MGFVNLTVLLFALLNIVLGIVGGLGLTGGRPSRESLIAGIAAGALLLGTLALAKTHPRWGRIGSAVICLLLLGRFAGPFFSRGTWYPAGLMVIAAGFTLAVLIGGHIAATRARKAGV